MAQDKKRNLMKKKLKYPTRSKTINYNLKRYNSMSSKEIIAATKVIRSGKLSPFVGAYLNDKVIGSFYGGRNVQKLEKKFQNFFHVKHAIAVNSWTSGLIAAVGALEISPGDEVIVSPWTMCATATAILHWGGIPVFADIDIETFNISVESIEKNISKRTKAIIITEVFGLPCNPIPLKKLAKKYNLKIISDTAQSITAKYNNKFAGTSYDIGGFSLNYHKHIQSGEGGVIITNNSKFAKKMQLIRNHGEAVVEKMGEKNLINIVGYNFRLGEIEAAIAIQQMKRVKKLVRSRIEIANKLSQGLQDLKGLILPNYPKNIKHVYYYYALKIDTKKIKKKKKAIFNELRKEGVPIFDRYENIHLLPMYRKKIAYGKSGFPWKIGNIKSKVSYYKGLCPNAEKLNRDIYLGIPICNYEFTNKDLNLIISSFKKVWQKIV